MGRFERIKGVHLKFRTEKYKGLVCATATIWINDKPIREIASLDLVVADSPVGEAYQSWVDAISLAFRLFMCKTVGINGITTKRQKPSYKGE